ncbi:hypothetical protein A3H19_06190 [Candidatus Woesebacteria bacterium RIFCSPLOWO2_12_FULL_39_9]|nr:MAG: hypothetical protein A3H19_06190 [Candidatus Woesebacteria bacterium RIFCSPLOWO2_12_FULL_39_9]
MKKKLLLGFFIILLASLTIYLLPKISVKDNQAPKQTGSSSVTPSPTGLISTSPKPSFSPSRTKSNVQYITVREPSKITLLSNLEERLTAHEAYEKNGCIYLVSGGFYAQNSKHIGLFVTEYKKLSESIDNPTFNGFFTIDSSGKPKISLTPSEYVRVALQSGPILYKDGKPQILNLKNDENARRLVVTVNRFDQVTFIAFYNQNNPVDGPRLADLPKLLDELRKDTNLDFDWALNLDGGSHSAFITETVNLKEISSIGGYFCIRP